METLRDELSTLQDRVTLLVEKLKSEDQKKQLLHLEAEASKPNFWQDPNKAKNVMQEIDSIKAELETIESIKKKIEDTFSVLEEESLKEEVVTSVKEVRKEIDKLETKTYLSGKYDSNNAILSIHAGQGGTEAMDWAQMLMRMYLRFTERQDWKWDVVEEVRGEEAGVKSATILVTGKYAYGYLKKEAGTHRLVRQSPFNADNLRQTSFALVEVLPEIEDTPDVQIKDEDLDWQFFRAGGHGGQNVNKVSTAVRLTHIPTGIVVTSQQERFQEKNREIALNLLRAKLWTKLEAESKEQVQSIKGEYRPAAWGTQIRSYVLHPYKMVKDLRTQEETGNTDAVLDGDLDQFIEAELHTL